MALEIVKPVLRNDAVVTPIAPPLDDGRVVTPAAVPAAATPLRAYAVDALRGLAFLGVALGEAKPYEVLPAWMYHAQEPPPTHEINPDIAGLTFPDLVFPFFLFTMGVAIPLALTRRIERGAGMVELLRRGVVTRFLLLMFLAFFRNHFDAGAYDALTSMEHQPQWYAWTLALAGFAVLFAIFTRFPDGWAKRNQLWIRIAGWTGAVLLFALSRFSDGTHVRLNQIDDILTINAYCVGLATMIWLATRNNPMARLGIVAAIAVLRLNDGHDGWISNVYNFEPFPQWYDFAFIGYLCVTIPGTIIGDLMLRWSRSAQPDAGRPSLFVTGGTAARSWTAGRSAAVMTMALMTVPLLLVGIQARYVFATTVGAALLCTAAIRLTRDPKSPGDTLISQLARWGTFWLLLGLLLDPVENGTHKEPATFAWMFQGLGLGIMVLLAFFIIIHVMHRRDSLQLLIDNGQNPMMGYVGYGMLVLPIIGLTRLKYTVESAEPSPWVSFAWGVLLTLAVAYIVRFFTRRRLFWRS
jgi:predicted acyltransferase